MGDSFDPSLQQHGGNGAFGYKPNGAVENSGSKARQRREQFAGEGLGDGSGRRDRRGPGPRHRDRPLADVFTDSSNRTEFRGSGKFLAGTISHQPPNEFK